MLPQNVTDNAMTLNNLEWNKVVPLNVTLFI